MTDYAKELIDAVLDYVEKHPGGRSKSIAHALSAQGLDIDSHDVAYICEQSEGTRIRIDHETSFNRYHPFRKRKK